MVLDCLYFNIILICLLSIPMLVWSARNKKKRNSIAIIILSVSFELFGVAMLLFVPDILYLEIGIEIIMIWLFGSIACLIYLAAVIICIVKLIRNKTKDEKGNNYFLIALIVPWLILGLGIARDEIVINNCNLVVVCEYHGNGGFGDYGAVAYAITDKGYKTFDIGVEVNGYYMINFLPKGTTEIERTDNSFDASDPGNVFGYYFKDGKYRIEHENDNILVYKDGNLLHKINPGPEYFNNDIKRVFIVR